MSGLGLFLDSNLGAAFFFFRLFLWHAALPQLFQAVLVYFRQSVAFFNKPFLPAPCHTGKIYCQQHHPQNLRK
jgi:hypothetical protein